MWGSFSTGEGRGAVDGGSGVGGEVYKVRGGRRGELMGWCGVWVGGSGGGLMGWGVGGWLCGGYGGGVG